MQTKYGCNLISADNTFTCTVRDGVFIFLYCNLKPLSDLFLLNFQIMVTYTPSKLGKCEVNNDCRNLKVTSQVHQ